MSRRAVVAPTFLLPLSGGGKSLRHTRRIVRHDVRAACSSHTLKRGGMGWGSHELQISDDTGGARHAPGHEHRAGAHEPTDAGARPLRAARAGLRDGLGGAARRQSRRQAAAAGERAGKRIPSRRLRARPALGRDRAVDRHGGQPASSRPRPRHRHARRPGAGHCHRHPAVRERGAGRRHLHDPAHGGAACAVHRARAGRTVEGRTDPDRGYAVPGARPRLCSRQAAGGANRQGAVARRLHLAGRHPGGAAAGHAAPDRGDAPLARAGLPVPHLGRGDRRRERARLSHLPAAPLSRHGRDLALRRLDHAARLRHRLRPGAPVSILLSLGLCDRASLMSALTVRNVWVEYGDQIVLERINLDIASGAFVSIVGPSGCGKSTFLRLLLGQERPTRGTIMLDGAPMPDEPGPDRGVVFQRYSVFPHLTVLGNVLVAFEFAGSAVLTRLHGKARAEAIAKSEALITAVGLREHRDKYPSALSGGMQQRLAIAQALARNPRVLLLDEPFGALDPGTRAQMHALIRPLWREHKMTIVMVTHDLKEAFGLGTRLIALDKPRQDPHAPGRYGAVVTYDLDLTRDGPVPVLGFLKASQQPDQSQGATP